MGRGVVPLQSVVMTAPGSPAIDSAVAVSNSQIQVKWTAPDNNGSPIDHYAVEWWSADKLYSHYQDKEKYTKSMGAIATAVTAAGGAVGNDPEDAATIAQARGGKPVATVATRDVLREGASKKYSLDLDPEAFPADATGVARARGNAFRRGWVLP